MGVLTNTPILLDESLSPQEQQQAADLVHQMDGEIVTLIDKTEICVATGDIDTKRYKMALACKIPVVNFNYILQCFAHNMLLPTDDYLISKRIKESPISYRPKSSERTQDMGTDDDEVAGAGASQDLVDQSRAQYQLKQNTPIKASKEVIPLPSFQIYVPPPITSPLDRRRSERILERDDDDEACDSVESNCVMEIFRTKSWPPEKEKDYSVKRIGNNKTINERISKSTEALLGGIGKRTNVPRGNSIFTAPKITMSSERNEYIKIFSPGTIPNTNIIALPAATTRLSKSAYRSNEEEVTVPVRREKGDKQPYFAFAVASRHNDDVCINKSVGFKLYNKDNHRKPITELQGVPYSNGINYFRAFDVVKPGNYILEASAVGVTPFLHEFVVTSPTGNVDTIHDAPPAKQTTSTGKRKYVKQKSVEVDDNNVKEDRGISGLFDDSRQDIEKVPRRGSPRSSKQSRSSIVGSSILNTISRPPDNNVFLSKAKVILTAFDVEEDKLELLKELKKQSRMFRVYDSLDTVVDDDLTHVIVPTNTRRGKTASILFAISKGIPIVTENWLYACIEAKTILPDATNFLHKLYKQHVGSTVSRTLFSDKLVYVLDHITSTKESVNYISKQHMEKAIAAAGGKILSNIQGSNFIICENYGDVYAYLTGEEPISHQNYLKRESVFTFKYISECVMACKLIDGTGHSKTVASIIDDYDKDSGMQENIYNSPSRAGRIGTPDSPSFY